MPLVPAKCPECGGLVEVDKEKRAGICQHCNNAFVIKDAIQTFNTYFQSTNNYNTTHNYGDGVVVNVYEDTNKEFVIEAGVLKEYHGASTMVEIPEGVTEVATGCFSDMNITHIKFSSTLQAIPMMLYDNIIVDVGNSQFKLHDGVIYNSDETVVERFIGGKDTYTLKPSVTTIHFFNENINHIFFQNKDIKEIPCADVETISLAERMGIKSIIKHRINADKNDYRCVNCNQFDLDKMPTGEITCLFTYGIQRLPIYFLVNKML